MSESLLRVDRYYALVKERRLTTSVTPTRAIVNTATIASWNGNSGTPPPFEVEVVDALAKVLEVAKLVVVIEELELVVALLVSGMVVEVLVDVVGLEAVVVDADELPYSKTL